DPLFEACVLSLGLFAENLVELCVASPLNMQLFLLSDGLCMEDEQFSVKQYVARVIDGVVQLRGYLFLGGATPPLFCIFF
ncbi:nitrite reductase (NAD(P)H) small subunit, partial [Salmonella enterica]|uniref:nitrite reductase (NAD(P)H) small subunit n=1 Tax=Salmonella enterica TaxID=28901 RepID=UPI0020C3BEE1